MDYDYEVEEEDYAPQVLWGRIGVYLGLAALIFFVGCSLGGGGTGDLEDEIESLTAQAAALTEENERLQGQIDALSSRLEADEGDADGTQVGDGDDRVHTVQAGDTLSGIAQRYCGNISFADAIAEANNSDGNLSIGEEILIPADVC